MKLRVLFGKTLHFRDGSAYYYPSGYTAYYVDIRTLAEDDIHVNAVKEVFSGDIPY
jgi:hypothetical protein